MTTDISKLHQLKVLQEEIISSIPNPWLFPTRGQVKGFMGTACVMFVGERPSTGIFGGPSDNLLYSLLEKHNVENAHLTDVIKTRGKVGEPYPADIANHRRVFDREIEIIKPHLIITFGQKVYDLLLFSLSGSGIEVLQVWHYSYTRRGQEKVVKFEDQIRHALAYAN